MINKVAEFKDRLDQALSIRNITPAELSKKTKISESTISQYRSGYAKPKDKKLIVISNALDINPTWLMGLDVPMEITTYTVSWPPQRPILSDHENKVIMAYRKAPESIQEAVDKLLDINRERKESASCG